MAEEFKSNMTRQAAMAIMRGSPWVSEPGKPEFPSCWWCGCGGYYPTDCHFADCPFAIACKVVEATSAAAAKSSEADPGWLKAGYAEPTRGR
jgi:hypothetical protein